MIRRPPRSTQSRSSAASDVYKRQGATVPSRNETGPRPRLYRLTPGHLIRDAGSERLQISSRRFAVLALLQFVLNFLAFVQGGQAGFFHGRDMHTHVFRAIICLNKAETLACVEPLHCSSTVSYTHLRAHETRHDLVCRLLLEKKK